MSCALFIGDGIDWNRFGGYQGIVRDSRDPEVLRYLREYLSKNSLGKDTGDIDEMEIFFINTEDKGAKNWQRLFGNTYRVEWRVEAEELVASLTNRATLRDSGNKPITQTVDFSGSYVLEYNAWGEPVKPCVVAYN